MTSLKSISQLPSGENLTETFTVQDMLDLTGVFANLEVAECVVHLAARVTGLPVAALKPYFKTDKAHIMHHLLWSSAVREFLAVPLWRQMAAQYPVMASAEILDGAELAHIRQLPMIAGNVTRGRKRKTFDPKHQLVPEKLDEAVLKPFRDALFSENYKLAVEQGTARRMRGLFRAILGEEPDLH